jgi:hypothetical protein
MARKKPSLHAVTSTPETRAASPSPVPVLFQTWGGHQHATRVALAMIYEHATRGSGALSANERILTRVCELRCALASGEWLGRLKANCPNELAAARFALNEIGAMNVAAYISATVTALRRANLLQQRDALLAKLERDLHAAGPALDTLIARFAQGLLDAGGTAPEDEELRAGPPAGGGERADRLVRRAGRKVGG